jgi:hypothetical protein
VVKPAPVLEEEAEAAAAAMTPDEEDLAEPDVEVDPADAADDAAPEVDPEADALEPEPDDLHGWLAQSTFSVRGTHAERQLDEVPG